MPIKNLTDDVQPRMPRLGKLRKGGEKVNGQYGTDLDHFRFTGATDEIEAAFKAVYGENPRMIQVYLPNETPQAAFTTWAEIWGKTGLVHRCDGENMTVWLEGGKYVRGSKRCPGGHENDDYLNDAVGRLDVIIPELVQAGFVGYVTLETHSKNDLLNIMATLQAVYNSRQHNPLGLRGILFNLYRVQESISTPGFGKQAGARSRVDKWLVKLEPAADWVRLQLEMAHNAQMGLLPAGDDDTVIEGEVKQPALPATTTTPPPAAPAPAKTNGNGAKPDLPAQINQLGEQLFPGCWAAKKQPLAKAYQTNGKTDLAKVLKFLETRKSDIVKLDQLAAHVKKSWPGYEEFIDFVNNTVGSQAWDRLKFLEGIAAAVKIKTERPEADNAELLTVILNAVPEANQPVKS